MRKFTGLVVAMFAVGFTATAEAPEGPGISQDDLERAAERDQFELLETGVLGPVSVLAKSPRGIKFMLKGADCSEGAQPVCGQVVALVEYDATASFNDRRVRLARENSQNLKISWQEEIKKLTIASLLEVPANDADEALTDFIHTTLDQARKAENYARRGEPLAGESF